jgi:hypothetical protein
LDVNSKELFTLSQNTHLRGNNFKLVTPKSVSVLDANFFVNRVVNAETLCPIVLLLLSPCLALSIVEIDLIFQTLLFCSSGSLSALAVVSLGISCILYLFSLLLYCIIYFISLVLSNKQTNTGSK